MSAAPLYALIDPLTKSVRFDRFTDYKLAVEAVGLNPGELDFGTIAHYPDGRTMTIMVYEYGLIKPKDRDGYWALQGQLYNGPAIIFCANSEGTTIDMPAPLIFGNLPHSASHIIWIGDVNRAETLILSKIVRRPQSSVNGEILWSWSPPSMER